MLLAGGAHASTLCLKNADGTYDTLRTGLDTLYTTDAGVLSILGGSPTTASSSGQSNTVGYGASMLNGSQPNAYSLGSLMPGYSSSGVDTTLIQSNFGTGAGNSCANGGATAANTVATIGDVAAATSSAGGNGVTEIITNNPKSATNATATGTNATAVGQGSVADRANSVSVGTAGNERQITNVAAGTTATDAANVAQMQAGDAATLSQANAYTDSKSSQVLNQANAYTDAKTANQVQYDTDASGNRVNSVTLVGGSTGPVTIHNVAAGTADTDAVNVAQMQAGDAATLAQANSYTDEKTKYFKANSTRSAAAASGVDAVAIGPESQASGTSSIAMGVGAKAVGLQSISIGTGNVVTGDHSGAIGDPSTVSGANSYALGNNNTVSTDNTFVVGNNVTTTQANSVVLGNNSADRAATTVKGTTINGDAYTFAGAGSVANGVVSVGGVGAERQIINVAAGEISATSTDAVNGSQLHATNQAVNKLGAKADTLGNSTAAALGGGAAYDATTGSVSAPSYTVNHVTYSNVGSAIDAIGSSVAANNSSNLPAASATGANSVAVGAGSVADRPNTVSVGSSGNERQITNVAAGTAPTDAVNVSQLRALSDHTQRMVSAMGAQGAAMAALMPNARAEGPLSVSVGVGTSGGVSALAAGVNYYASNRVLLNLKASTAVGAGLTANRNYTVGAGATFGF